MNSRKSEFGGKVALVTGADRGIGRAIAIAFAESGADVAIHYRNGSEAASDVARECRELGVHAITVAGDLSSFASSEVVVEQTVDRLRRLDIVVNNAGSMIARRAADHVDEIYLTDVVTTNLASTVAMSCAAMPHLKHADDPGCIVNIGSVSGRTGGGTGAALYGAAKAAVATYTRGLAREVGPFGVRVNAVSPGVVRTSFHDRFSTEASLNALASSIPLGRLATPEEVAGPVLFLSSARAAGYVTGQVIEVNGGMYSP